MGFLLEYLKKPFVVGAVVPSSRFLTAKMLKPVDFSTAKTIVELGAGTGVHTKEMLARMRKDAHLYVFEIHPPFVKKLRELDDGRITLLTKSAEQLSTHVKNADAVISSLPLMSFPKKTIARILAEVKKTLAKDGVFVQFQYGLKSYAMLRKEFADVKLDFTPFNLPPAFVYRCRK